MQVVHTEFTQAKPLQLVSQLPQLSGSVVVFVHVPEHRISPAGQFEAAAIRG
jgi:hypothetical protein